MIRFFAVVAITLLAVLPAWAAPVVSIPAAEFDFGSVYQGETARHTFTFANRGDAPLTVDKISSSCGCTAALASTKTLAPGERGELQVSFDSARFRGEVSKLIYLYTNDPAQPVSHFTIKGKVQPEVVIEPQLLNFGTVSAKRPVKGSLRLVNQGAKAVTLQGLETTTPELSARLSAASIPPGGAVTLDVTLNPKPGQGRFSGYLLLKADGMIRHELRIPVYADLGERS